MKFQVSRFKGLKFKVLLFFLLFTVHYSLLTVSYAAHPLITDDTGTAGKGKFELEIGGEYGHEKEEGVKEDTTEIVSVFVYGITDNIDVELSVPYTYIRTKEAGTTTEDGISDIEINLKWRFWEKDGLSFALKPLISLPTGDEERGLGTGRITYSLFFFATKEVKPLAFDLNVGYIRNENKVDERKNLWHASAASRMDVVGNLNVVVDIGIETNTDKSSDTHPAFILGGIIYSISEKLDIDFGIKTGLNKAETDYALLAGTTLRF